jgi:hypothetical protein
LRDKVDRDGAHTSIEMYKPAGLPLRLLYSAPLKARIGVVGERRAEQDRRRLPPGLTQQMTVVTFPAGTGKRNCSGEGRTNPRTRDGESVKRHDPLVEARVMNQLQKRKHGQTIEQLQNTLKTPQAEILTVLKLYQNEGHVTMSKSGVWTLVRE